MKIKNSDIIEFLKKFAPLELAESWDNVGLILGRSDAETDSLMTCLTLTPDVANEAIKKKVSLIVSHHPIFFRPIQKISCETSEGKMALSLIEAGVAVYSPHTAFDSATNGINQFLAERLGLENIQVLRRKIELTENENLTETSADAIGSGRFGNLPKSIPLEEVLQNVKGCLSTDHLKYTEDSKQKISKIGIACGSAAEYLDDALSHDCDLFLTGEAQFHDCLKARNAGISMILTGHYASERIAVEELASIISKDFPSIEVWASKIESNPLKWI